MPSPACPKCQAAHSRRIRREGFLQQAILRRLGYFPWECRFCKATFSVKNRGRTKPARNEEAVSGSPMMG